MNAVQKYKRVPACPYSIAQTHNYRPYEKEKEKKQLEMCPRKRHRKGYVDILRENAIEMHGKQTQQRMMTTCFIY